MQYTHKDIIEYTFNMGLLTGRIRQCSIGITVLSRSATFPNLSDSEWGDMCRSLCTLLNAGLDLNDAT